MTVRYIVRGEPCQVEGSEPISSNVTLSVHLVLSLLIEELVVRTVDVLGKSSGILGGSDEVRGSPATEDSSDLGDIDLLCVVVVFSSVVSVDGGVFFRSS